MELILLQKVTNLGNLGDKVTVKPGYGRNFLVPQGKAVPATAANLAEFETRRAEYEAKAQALLGEAEQRKASLGEEASVTIYANASTEGKLYGSVGPREIAEALTKRGTEVGKSEVVMGEGAIRQVGEYNVMLHLHADVEVPVKVIVEAEPA
ncbi:50S ribosomal protein L9 [Cognatiluteimonas lumbrici]|uniref:50S ribosomal protein L9 n=1 Tax=Cognatiluteimonas lumbrici TaxID=2559601 RepID=UPI00112AE541|nr:50S ribosomal protein L9 [Luteimonas lumbrici]